MKPTTQKLNFIVGAFVLIFSVILMRTAINEKTIEPNEILGYAFRFLKFLIGALTACLGVVRLSKTLDYEDNDNA